MTHYYLTIGTNGKQWDYTFEDSERWLPACKWEESYDKDEDGDGADLWHFKRMVFKKREHRAMYLNSYRMRNGEPI